MFRSLTILSLTNLIFLSNSMVMAQSELELSLSATQLVEQSSKKYGYSHWLNGFRKNPTDNSPDKLAFETSHYGFVIDLGDLSNARFGTYSPTSYSAALDEPANKIETLPQAELLVQLACNNRVYTAKHCLTGPAKDAKRLQDTWMWEAGRYVQHYDLQHLVFEDKQGEQLSCEGKLKIVSWPDSLTFTSEITAKEPFIDGPSSGVSGNARTVTKDPYTLEGSNVSTNQAFTLECWVNIPSNPAQSNNGWLLHKKAGDVDDGQLGFFIRGGRVEAVMNVGAGHRQRHRLGEAGHRRFDYGEWNHLALSYDGETMKFYVDGHQQSSKNVSGERQSLPFPFQLGNFNEKHKQHSFASYDQVRIWQRALSVKEIKSRVKQPARLDNKVGLLFEKTFDAPSDPKPIVATWKDATMRIQLRSTEQTWQARSPVSQEWKIGETKKLSLNCSHSNAQDKDVSLTVHTQDGRALTPIFQPELNSYVTEISRLKRTWKSGYTDIKNYDEFTLELENTSNSVRDFPFMLYLRDVANITGLVPLLCYEDGTPTGVPVQLSKNWHYPKLGSYLRAYSLLPVAPGKHRYKLRIVYGFYGSLPSASHAQLSLIGYGGNSRWDQLAIGSWGETICFDIDRSLVDVAVTDVRLLMARKGKEGKKWGWTEAGWGGDWIRINDLDGKRHHPNGLKTSYLAHGPCLTDARYAGNYGAQDELAFNAQVQTLRTDDYARAFQKFSYTFEKEVSAQGSWLLKMGSSFHYSAPHLAYGNADGLSKDISVPNSLKAGDMLIDNTKLSGPAPWWISFYGSHPAAEVNKGNGYRALVIRSYQATLGGTLYSEPSISAPVYQVNTDGSINLDLLLNAPQGIEKFQVGDTIEMDLEWITLHREADDYYGPNEHYRKHLTKNPNSWKTTYREAIGNDLTVEVEGGKLHRNYPIQIQSQADEVKVQIKGGVGFVPIRFSGLKSATGYTLYQVLDGKLVMLDQAINGNDFWQTDYQAAQNSFSRVYNLPLDQLPSSEWVLKKERE